MKHIIYNEKDWHALRAQVVTASEAAVLVGADPYSSPRQILNREPFEGNAFTFVGQMLEEVVVKITNKVLGTNFELYEQEENVKEFYINNNLGATPDAHQDRKMLLECKTTRPKTYMKYSAVPPSKYIIQNVVQQICVDDLESDFGYLSILSTDLTQNSSELRWPITIYKIWKNSELCNILKEESDRFKKCTETNKQFRVNSKVKQKVKLLLATTWERAV